MSQRLIICLHGVGSNGRDLAPFGELLARALPETASESPNAPQPFGHGPGYQWFSLDGVTERDRSLRVERARDDFDRVVGGLIEFHGFASRLDQVALIGFSQGSIMALDALASGRWPVGAVVAFAGRLATPEPLAPALSTSLLLVHGEADPVIPAIESQRAAERLGGLGVEVESHRLPGVAHTINQQGVQLATDFLAARFAQRLA